MKAYKVTRPSISPGNWCVYRDGASLIDGEFDGAEPGDKILVELIDMPEEELNNLPDFEGW